jgi:uncharacterized membrane protein YgcG
MTSLVPTVTLPGKAMPLADPELWARIQAHPFDKPGVDMPFSRRLAEENGWTDSFALEVIEEYRRFVYLACTAGEEVTPSDEVDQVWHLHLTYSRDYWGTFCADVLRRPLHHGPTEGGPAERSRYEANYFRTMELYQQAFGMDGPPMHIWPPSQIRFNPKSRFARVNMGLFKIAPRKSTREKVIPWLGGISFAGCMLTMIDHRYTSLIPLAFLCFTAVIALDEFWPGKSKLPRKLKKSRQETVRQPQHGYLIGFTVTYGVVSGVETMAISDASVSGDGDGGGGDGGGDSGCGGGCGGGGCGGCGG